MHRVQHDWPGVIARLQRSPGRWQLVFPNVSTRLVRYIRQRKSPKLRLPGGAIEALARNTYTKGGQRYGDVYLRYVPTGYNEPTNH